MQTQKGAVKVKKRWIIAGVLLLVGIMAMLLLPWEFVLCDCEDYRLAQTPFGGTLTIKKYDQLIQDQRDYRSAGVSGNSVDEVVGKLLSGEADREMYHIANRNLQKQLAFPGLSMVCTPVIPKDFKRSQEIAFDGIGTSCGFQSQDFFGTISACQNGTCRECLNFKVRKTDAQERSEGDALTQYGQWTVLDNSTGRYYISGKVDGGYCTIELNPKGEAVLTEKLLNQFSMTPYYPKQSRLIAVRVIGIGWLAAAALVLSGTGLTVGNLMKGSKKNRA